jgi:hypothetical protein
VLWEVYSINFDEFVSISWVLFKVTDFTDKSDNFYIKATNFKFKKPNQSDWNTMSIIDDKHIEIDWKVFLKSLALKQF